MATSKTKSKARLQCRGRIRMKYLGVSLQASTEIPYVMLVRHSELDKGFTLYYFFYVRLVKATTVTRMINYCKF